MINEAKVVQLKDGVTLNMMKSDKFKTDLIGVYIKRPLTEDEATMNTLLTRLLNRATETYRTSKELQKKLDEMYGAILVSDVVKYGEKQILVFKIQVPNGKRLQDESIFEEAAKILNEIINKPLLMDGKLSATYFDTEVANLKNEIASRVNDKVTYAVERCIEEMCSEEPFKIYSYGSIEALEKITPIDLYEHYKKILRSSEINVCVIGDVHFNDVEQTIDRELDLSSPELMHYEDDIIVHDVKGISVVEDHMNINQGKLSIGYRTGVRVGDPMYEASMLFSYIYGGGANSKLFMNVREKESLCYYIFARAEKYKGLMVIGAGIEFENYQKTLDIIDVEFNKMLDGDFTDEDIRIAKEGMISGINSISDFPNSYINYYYSTILTNVEFDLEDLKDRINRVTKDDIIAAGKMMKKDTIHFLNKEA